MDFNNPRADEIIRDLGKKTIDGIESLMNAAEYEHKDIDVLKHLLTTASFAKKFSDPQDLDPNQYVLLVKHSIVLTKLRHSPILARAITYQQLKAFKAKNIAKLLLKYRDYRLAITVIKQLNLKNLSLVYEDWCTQMLKYSAKNERVLIDQFEGKFDELASELAIDQGFSYSAIEQARREKQELKQAEESPAVQQLRANNLLNKVKLQIDFTKLANIAHHHRKFLVSDYLIAHEKQIVKKIPFLLQVKQHQQALQIAVDGGDPNNINKVLSEILKEVQNDGEEAVRIAATVPDGLRHFRNFAKKRRDGNNLNLLRQIYEHQNSVPEKMQSDFGLQALGQDHAEITECLKTAY